MVGRVAPRAPVWDPGCGARGAARPTYKFMKSGNLDADAGRFYDSTF